MFILKRFYHAFAFIFHPITDIYLKKIFLLHGTGAMFRGNPSLPSLWTNICLSIAVHVGHMVSVKPILWCKKKSFELAVKNIHGLLFHFLGVSWQTGALSALADRIKIARGGLGDDINLSIQYLLNCGAGVAGSCWGGSHSGVSQPLLLLWTHDLHRLHKCRCLSYTTSLLMWLVSRCLSTTTSQGLRIRQNSRFYTLRHMHAVFGVLGW